MRPKRQDTEETKRSNSAHSVDDRKRKHADWDGVEPKDDKELPCNNAVNTKRCPCRNLKVPHDYTMMCAECRKRGCGLEISLYTDATLCRRCARCA
jgi:hypothetical protein